MTNTGPKPRRCYYCHCGAPLWRGEGCRLCWLTQMTSYEVRAHDEEGRGWTAEGEALSSADRWMVLDALTEDPFLGGHLNATADTRATSTWLPVGCSEHREGFGWYSERRSQQLAAFTSREADIRIRQVVARLGALTGAE